jgi:hypothetical protein
VKTEIFKNGWGGKTPSSAVMTPGIKMGMDPEVSGERSLCLITSSLFGGKGVPLPEGTQGGLTVLRLREVPYFVSMSRSSAFIKSSSWDS